MTGFIEKLKRRNVFRVAAAYAFGSWILIEAGSVLLPTFGASESQFRVYVLFVIAGFLVAVVAAWIFEITPEGIRLEKDLERAPTHARPSGRKLDFFIIALLGIALGISITLNVTGLRGHSIEPSIAVLPFDSRSTNPENAIFADGIHDDLLTRLANVEALKVISRTSVMEYRDTTKNLRQIANELGVATVLEGAVQRSGDNVRINVQLIDAETDEHLWAQTYDRQLTARSIFEIQSEISAAIAAALQAKLTPREKARLATIPTENIEAYRLYVAGRHNLHERELDTLLAARQQFEAAIAIDPKFAPAYAGLADAVQLLDYNHSAITSDEAFGVAESALQTALELDDELADAYASRGLLGSSLPGGRMTGEQLSAAEVDLTRAIELNPSHARAYMWLGNLRGQQGRFEEAIELNKRSLEFDPIGRIPYANLAVLYARLGRHDEALEQWLRALQIHPGWPRLYANISAHLERLGRLDEAVAWSVRARELSRDPAIGLNLVRIFFEFGDYDRARDINNTVPPGHPLYGSARATAQMIRLDFTAALAIMESNYGEQRNAADFIFDRMSDIALLAGDLDKALAYCLRQDPSLATDDNPRIDDRNAHNAVKLAYILQQKGEHDRAEQLLAAALPVVQDNARLGIVGAGIRDVQILTLQGETDAALAVLREAVDEGFRSSLPFDGWTLELDPYLEAIRDHPEFLAIIAEIDAVLAIMGARVVQAEASGDWDELLEAAGQGLRIESQIAEVH
ncbi:MAG: tetratricopeptide repeat protein [Gammaproteobacteria bacterium]|nr:tetratricopeptide repeat protein [Gammaproteobacteria bacterium]